MTTWSQKSVPLRIAFVIAIAILVAATVVSAFYPSRWASLAISAIVASLLIYQRWQHRRELR